MELEDYVAALRRDGAALADAATDLTRPVPSCPDWTAADLVWHVGKVHDFWLQMAVGMDPEARVDLKRPADPDLVPWFSEGVEALAAAGRDEPIERGLAVDGIDEFLEFFLPAVPPDGLGDLHLHTTDGPGEWLISPGTESWVITREHAKGAAAVRASASDLLLLLWRRKGVEVAQVFGDEELVRRFLASSKLDLEPQR